MFAIPTKPYPKKTRADYAMDVSRVVARIPLLSEILRMLAIDPSPHAGDDDIRHGCERAMNSILAELSRITIAPPGNPSPSEEAVRRLLDNERNESPIDPETLGRVLQSVERILDARKV